MALRILLADESATIKKVIELSLQDYAVDLRIVNLGVDVLEVASSFNPDLIFVDILLQKKNGYEVCHELKSNEATKNIPVVVLWSGFMELDQAKLQVVGADDTLEKPFDSDTLRSLVNKYVPSASEDNPLLQHVQVPDIPAPNDFTQVRKIEDINLEMEQMEPQAPSAPSIQETPEEEPAGESWNMDSFDGLPDFEFPDDESENSEEDEIDLEEDDFSHFEIKTPSSTEEAKPDTLIEMPEDDADGNAWVNQSLGKFQLDLPESDDDMEELNNLEVGEVSEPIEDTSFLWNPEANADAPAAPTNNETPSFEVPEMDNSLESQEVEDIASAPENLDTENITGLKEVPKLADIGDIPTSTIGNTPTEDEIASAPEISLEEKQTDTGFEIEHNHELGIETHDDPAPLKTETLASATSSSNDQAIQDFLNSPNFQSMVQNMVEQKLGEAIERLVPEMAKEQIEKEIQRLLDEPFQE